MTTVFDILSSIKPSLVASSADLSRPYQLLTRQQASVLSAGSVNTYSVAQPVKGTTASTAAGGDLKKESTVTSLLSSAPAIVSQTPSVKTSQPIAPLLTVPHEVSSSDAVHPQKEDTRDPDYSVKANEPTKTTSAVAASTNDVTTAAAPQSASVAAPVSAPKAAPMSVFAMMKKSASKTTGSDGNIPPVVGAVPQKEPIKPEVKSSAANEPHPTLKSPSKMPSKVHADIESVDDDDDNTTLVDLAMQVSPPPVIQKAPLSAEMEALLKADDDDDNNSKPAAPPAPTKGKKGTHKAPASDSAAKKPAGKKSTTQAPAVPVEQAAVLSSINDDVIITAPSTSFTAIAAATPAPAPLGSKRAREEVQTSDAEHKSTKKGETSSDGTEQPVSSGSVAAAKPTGKGSSSKSTTAKPAEVVNTNTASASVLRAFCSPELAAFQKAYTAKAKSTVKLDPSTNTYHCSEVTVYVNNATGAEISSEEHKQLREEIMSKLTQSAAEAATLKPEPVATSSPATATGTKAAEESSTKAAKAPSTKKARAEAASAGYKTNPLACLFGKK